MDPGELGDIEIIVLRDSLPFGRPKYGICRDKTWPCLLRCELDALLCMRARGGATSLDVLAEAASLAGYWFGSLQARRFDAAFVQVGTVDVSPRLMPKSLYPYASRIPGFSRLQRSNLLHKVVGKPWVFSAQFAQAIARIDKLLGRVADQVYFIEIARRDYYLKENIGDFSSLASCRNLLIYECIGENRFVRCWEGVSVPQILLPDGHHLNVKGHQVVAKKCLEKIHESA